MLLEAYFVVLTLKNNFIKHDKYAFPKYVVFKNINMLFQNTTDKKANTLIFAFQSPYVNLATFIVIRHSFTNLATVFTSLNLSGTYPAKASTGPPSCTSPREPTICIPKKTPLVQMSTNCRIGCRFNEKYFRLKTTQTTVGW